jgi:putative ABC transport system permease protein
VSEPLLPRGVRRAFRLALRTPRVEQEVDAEVAFHLEMRAAELVARGLTPEAARAEALRRFGDTHQWSSAMSAVDRERAAGERRAEWLDDLRQDLRYATRSLLRAPLFALLAVLTLALGIGANAAVFGVLKSVLLDALPYADAGRVVRLYGRAADGSREGIALSVGTIVDTRERQRSFASLAGFNSTPSDAVVTGDADGPRVVKIEWTEPALFRTLGVTPALGRAFRDDDAGRDTARVVLLTYAAWQRLFGGDPEVLRRPVVLNGIPREVAGVLPRGFVGPVGEVDMYLPLDLAPLMRNPTMARNRFWWGAVARLEPGVTLEAARQDVAAIGARLAQEHPQQNGGMGMTIVPVRDDMVGDTRTPLLVLMASAGLVLLITCANLAGALLSRTLSRRKEFAVRVALGAGRGRLVRQLLTESMLLALAGGAAGVLLATLGLAALRGLARTALPSYADLSLDAGALLFTGLLALATGLAFGVAPALSVSRADPQGTLRDESRGASESRRSRQLRGLLVAGQIALCVSLLAGAGLLVRSLVSMTSSPLGFDPNGVLSVAVPLPRSGYPSDAARARFMEQFEERLRALPGVSAAASAGQLPTRVRARNGFLVEGAPPAPADARPAIYTVEVSDSYFRTMGIPLRAGRTFGPEDRPGAPFSVVISESAARRYLGDRDPIGARVRLAPDSGAPVVTVVGVVGDVRNDPAKPEPMMYMANRQAPWNGPFFVVRTRGGAAPLALVSAVRRELAALDPRVPLHGAMTLDALVADNLSGRRLPVVLMAAFGALALVLASVGVYAMFAAMAAAREREFGVRVALGSTRRDIAALVLRQGGVWMAVGLAAGAAGVVVVSRMLRGLLFGVPPFDPVALGAALALLLVAASVALLAPVRRATRVDPISVLR